MNLRARASLALLSVVLFAPVLIASGVRPAGAAGTPHIDTVTPDNGWFGGGTAVTISGTNLTGATTVTFGFATASFTVVDDSTITATTPDSFDEPGPVTLTVTTADGTSNGLTYTYNFIPPPPVLTSVSPDHGTVVGGDAITIDGAFINEQGLDVTFGGSTATPFQGNGPGEILVFVPPHAAGAVDVVLTTDGGTSTLTNGYTYVDAPTVTGLSPNRGLVAGGTSVTITGLSFTSASGVTFGTTPATSFTLNSNTSITAVAPAGTGSVDVTVTTPLGTSTVGSADVFSYGNAPVVSSVSPSRGLATGGTTVTITGTDFTAATAVTFGASPATGFTVDSPTSITATSPDHAAGAVDVTVVTPFGPSATGAGDQFTFVTPVPPVPPAPPPAAADCCRLVASDGGVFALNGAQFYGSMGGRSLAHPIVGITSTSDNSGYWLAASDGGVFAFGDARYSGSMGGRTLTAPIVAMATTPDGGGYWLVASDGGVFAFGDAHFSGSMGGIHVNAPIVGMTATHRGYRLVASDGGVFAFGDAPMFGSMGGRRLSAPIVGMAAASDGYELAGRDGSSYAFSVSAHGAKSATAVNAPIVGIA